MWVQFQMSSVIKEVATERTHRGWPFLVTRTVFASRAFSVAPPTVWNSLPDNIVNFVTLETFKKRLKTHLFRCVI